MELDIKLLPWQQEVWQDPVRFKVIAAGRRTGKSRMAAWALIVEALQADKGHVWYVAPTQQQARDIMWSQLLELAHPVIAGSHVNNMQVKLVNGSTISLKGADRPETMRGVALKFLVLDEYADIKPQVFEQILRPALADLKGKCVFIGTPKGRNHFYDLFKMGQSGKEKDWKAWHFTSLDNPLLDPEEIEVAKASMSSFSFRQEFLASFEAPQSEIFKDEWIKVEDKDEEPDSGMYYMAVDLAGFEDVAKNSGNKKKHLDQTAIAVVKVHEDGWWVDRIEYGRWDIKETAAMILKLAKKYEVTTVGIEKGALKNAVLPYLQDLMMSTGVYPKIVELTHGNKKKTDRIVWALQGRMEHGQIVLCEGEWVKEFKDQLLNFPTTGVHDDLIDALSYIDQLAITPFTFDDFEDDYEPLDMISGY
jgi:predicted phage terminase large subunit-like protein